MKPRKKCDRCNVEWFRLRPIQVRVVFGIHTKTKNVFARKVHYWCSQCCSLNDGKWRHAK